MVANGSRFIAVLITVWALELMSCRSRVSSGPTVSTAPCITSPTSTDQAIEVYRFADTTTDDGMTKWRESLSLGRIPVDQIILANNSMICRRALAAFNTLFGDSASFRPVDSVYVILYGKTRFIVGNSVGPYGGEWRYEPIFDTSFTKVAIAGR